MQNLSKNDNKLLTNDFYCIILELSRNDNYLSFIESSILLKEVVMKKFIPYMSKFLEVFFLLFTVGAIAFTVMSAVNPEYVYSILKLGLDSAEMNVLGFGVQIADASDVAMKFPMVVLFAISIPVSLNVVMIFRNIYLIYRTAEGKTKFSKGNTPFQKDVVRMVREIGIFSIGIPVFQFIGSLIIKLFSHGAIETNVIITSLIFGIVIVNISEFFSYGVKLEEEVEGLV